MLAYFYIALFATLLPLIIIDGYWFRSMTAFNTYIAELLRMRVAFLMEFQGLKFFSEVVETIAEVGNNFAIEVKQRNNWEQAGYYKENLDGLSASLYMANVSQ